MKKTIISIIIVAGILAAGFITFINQSAQNELPENTPPITTTITDPRDATYTINEELIPLVNGVSYTKIPGSEATTTTTYFGNEVAGDFEQDGTEDSAFIVTQSNGSSGTFYYVVAKLNKKTGAIGSYGVLLGDRIAPQSTSLGANNTIIVNYADRKPGEPFTAKPSIGKSIILKFDPMTNQFGEVVKDFEGEASPSTMKLDMKTWTWINTQYNDGQTITSKNTEKFKLTFKGKTFSVSTDCNGIGGEFTTKGSAIAFDKMMSTLMYCEGSQETDFSKALSAASSYHFTSKGELVLDLKYDSGVVVFR